MRLMERHFRTRLCVLLVGLGALVAQVVYTQAPQNTPTSREYFRGLPVAEGEVLVRFRSNTAGPPYAHRDTPADARRPLGPPGGRRLHSASRSVQTLLTVLSSRSEVVEVEPNYVL